MRYAALIEYLGNRYHGWQQQAHCQDTIQAELQRALTQIANQPIRVVAAGRTDTGVHASGQIIHFDTTSERQSQQWVLGTNHLLPKDISIKAITLTNFDFHARFSAIARQYDYYLYTGSARSAIYHKRLTHIPQTLDLKAMQQASQYLLGQHDFSSFQAAGCQAHSPVRTMQAVSIIEQQQLFRLRFKANAFLYRMIRNLIGSLIEIGLHNQPPNWINTLIVAKNRSLAASTASADGLYLSAIDYPSTYQNVNHLKQHQAQPFIF